MEHPNPNEFFEKQRLRDIAEEMQRMMVDNVDLNDPSSLSRYSFLYQQRSSLLSRIARMTSSPHQDSGVEIRRLYVMSDVAVEFTEVTDEREATPEELEAWVDSVLIDDPVLGVRLGLTDDMPVREKALAILFHQPDQV